MNSGATFANEARATRGRTASEVPPGPVPARAAARRLRPSQLPPNASTGCAVSQPAAGMRPLHVPVGRRSACAAPMPGKMASASGSGTVTSTYTPEATDKSTKIVFIQVMREILDGAPSKPSESDPNFTYQDADTTADFYHVDYVSGEKDPYYNGDDPGDIGTQGNAAVTPKVNATMQDTPHYRDGSFPVGKSRIQYEFRDAAFSAGGADAGSYYAFVNWVYEKQKGVAETTAIGSAQTGHPGSQFVSAVRLWNSNHSFKMPGEGQAAAGAIIGALGGAATGAAIGSLLGPIGALVGGIVGAVAGGIAGGFIGAGT